ncbi:MAG: hypothetical protein COA78_18110 [Blastopirellula sp.]|nr:MAG: hypothetical protein COA78_18110 [Blastopirellula sp.]
MTYRWLKFVQQSLLLSFGNLFHDSTYQKSAAKIAESPEKHSGNNCCYHSAIVAGRCDVAVVSVE